MSSLLPFSVCRRMVTEGLHWKQIKPQLFHQRKWLSTVQQSKTSAATPHPVGPEGQTAPENFDGGDYDEEKNEQYEQEAEQRAMRYRRIKKVLSTGLFVSVLGFVGYSRRGKREEVSNNIKTAKFLTDDGLFKGSEAVKVACLYELPQSQAKVVLPAYMVKNGTIAKISDFQLKDGDILVASFPKTGTTWIQEIVYLISNDLDFKEASKQVMETRFPYFEYQFPGLSTIEKMPLPRLIKTHLPFDFLPKTSSNAKIIYITRNPKDTVVSYYHFSRMFTMASFIGSFDDFVEKFEKDELLYCPFFDHVESYVRHKDDPNILILTYEKLSTDPAEVIEKVAQFLGKPLSQEDINKLVVHTRFDNMAKNASVNYEHWDDIGFRNKNEAKFMRKGKIGDWKNYFNKEENEKFDEWIRSGNKIQFPFEYEG